ncbi:hypothetical protein [Microcoleus asticus]|uniref:Uncharacterized protein n=1 Tax=Microcoleus asticus IPMA8 TaxID=2563858 RepID=A0ABX2D471_9CYAN|nr:hypothetical protein [Microcoleus asticus]NQE36752.1 hypothetical protein [Microcoleus asticus IPMA8]
MPFYILVNSTGIEEEVATELPQLPELQKLVGFPGEEAYLEPVYQCYSDPSIVILCDEEFLRKACQPTMLTPKRVILQGQLLVVAIDPQIEDFCLLTQQQVELVKRETKLYQATPQ